MRLDARGVDHLHIRRSPFPGKRPEAIFADPAQFLVGDIARVTQRAPAICRGGPRDGSKQKISNYFELLFLSQSTLFETASNCIEALNRSLREVIKIGGRFPN
jgi:hypothetical protein